MEDTMAYGKMMKKKKKKKMKGRDSLKIKKY